MPFKKGQSGNPKGRKRELELAEIRELAKKRCPRAIERLAEWMESDNPRASVAACESILNQGLGKPPQAVELTGKDGKDLTITINIQEKAIRRAG